MKEEQKTEAVEPAAEQTQEQAPLEGQAQEHEAADVATAAGQKTPKAGLKESIIPTVQKPHVDQNKTEGGVLLDAIISNAYAAYQRRKQKQEAAQKEVPGNNPGDKISPEGFKQLMEQLQKEGVNLDQLHKNGDMDRLLQGRITKEIYSRTPVGSWVERSGPLFIGSDNQIHQTLIKQDNVMEKDLTAQQNAQLKKDGELLKGNTLIKRDPKTRRVQRIPASQAARQRHKKQISKKVQVKGVKAKKKTMMKRGL